MITPRFCPVHASHVRPLILALVCLSAAQAMRANPYGGGPPSVALTHNTLVQYVHPGGNATDQWCWVWNAGTGAMTFALFETTSWMSVVAPTNGISTAGAAVACHLTFSTTGLPPGLHRGPLMVMAPGATNSPQVVWVLVDNLATGDFRGVFTRHIVTNVPGSGYIDYVNIADVDRDGHDDLLGVFTSTLAWWANDRACLFTNMHVIDPTFNDARCIAAPDLDNDGDNDILGASMADNDIAWWENNGQLQFIEHFIDTSFSGARRALPADLDNDGVPDVVGAATTVGDIKWWHNGGFGVFSSGQTVDLNFTDVRDIIVKDIDGDGRQDIAGASFAGDQLAWWRNTGSVSFAKIVIASNFDGAACIDAADIDGDGDMDFVGGAPSDNDLSWFMNTGSYTNFIKYQFLYSLDCSAVKAVDLDNDGDMDIVGADDTSVSLRWYRNDGSENFTEFVIDETYKPIYLQTADLNGDGWRDLVGGAGTRLIWWENGGTNAPVIAFTPAALSQQISEGDTATDQWFTVWNSSIGTLSYSLYEPAEWMTQSPTSGACAGNANTHRIDFSTASLTAGIYQAEIAVAAHGIGALNAPQHLPVTLDVVPEPSVLLGVSLMMAVRRRSA
ncbi:VCBS repeat-containing protein [bacterium]|nr:VCBS repeat-containing protein [bacterium]